jgi:elongation factor G
MKRYNVPRLAFINKCDRTGSDPARVINELETKLGHVAVPLQIPIGLEGNHVGVVDLVKMEAVYFEGPRGETVRIAEIPAELREAADRARHGVLDTLSLYSDELMELMLEDKPISTELLYQVIREQTIAREITPVLMGSAFKNRGVQLLLDAVSLYLPTPMPRSSRWHSRLWTSPLGSSLSRVSTRARSNAAAPISTAAHRRSSASGVFSACMPTTARTSTKPRPATSWP